MKLFFSKKIVVLITLLLVVFCFLNTTKVFSQQYPSNYGQQMKEYQQNFGNNNKGFGSTIVDALINGLEVILVSIQNITLKFLIIPIVDFVSALSGKLMDISIDFTIFRSFSFSNSGGETTNPLTLFDSTIKEIWKMIRDGINIVFIFTLLYIAIKRILGDFKKNIFVGVLVSAVFVNFSFFATRTIIDIGNIFAGAIYNQIEIKAENFNIDEKNTVTNVVSKILEGSNSQIKLSTITRNISGIDSLKDKSSVFKAEGLLYNFIILITSLTLTFVFISMTFLFIGRFIMLIFLMASSPIGFLFGSIPKIASYTSKWWDTLIKQVVIAPIFMFFILIVINIAQNDTLKNTRTGEIGIGLIFNFILIISTLIIALKITKGLSGQVASFAGKATSFVAGAALGAVTGGAALAGRQLIGRGAAKLASGSVGTALQQRAAKGGFLGGVSNLTLKGIKGTSNASFDVRGSKTVQNAMGQMKSLSGGAIDIKGAMDSVGNFGKVSGDYGKDKKGFSGWKEKQKEEIIKRSQEYDKIAKDTEKKAELDAQNKYQVIEKRLEEEKAKKEFDKAENDLATASATERVAKKAERDRLEMEYLAKKGAREISEKNTAAHIKNEAETRFENDMYVSPTDTNKAAYRAAEAKIKAIRSKQETNKNTFDASLGSKKDKEKYNQEEAKLQEELKTVKEEMEKAKAAGIESQIKEVEKEILLGNKKDDQGVIKILKARQMRKDYAEQLRKQLFTLSQLSRVPNGIENLLKKKIDFSNTEAEEFAKLVESDKGTSKEKSEEEKTLAALLKQIEKLNDKK